MLDKEPLHGLISLGGFLGFGGLVLTLFQPQGSAEQVLSACSAAMGFGLLAIIIGAVRLRQKR